MSKYLTYLQNNPEGYWFKRKLYGYGWTPARTQGWVVTIIFLGLIIANTFTLETDIEPTQEQLLWFFGRTVLLVVILIIICYKTGEKPKWQWGIPKENNNQ